jgi:hypothetical protein
LFALREAGCHVVRTFKQLYGGVHKERDRGLQPRQHKLVRHRIKKGSVPGKPLKLQVKSSTP